MIRNKTITTYQLLTFLTIKICFLFRMAGTVVLRSISISLRCISFMYYAPRVVYFGAFLWSADHGRMLKHVAIMPTRYIYE